MKDAKLPRRDWILLPVLSLLTIGLIVCSMELIARRVFNASNTLMSNCMVMDDPSTGPRAMPNTVCWEKSPESPLVEYKFNNCGHHAGVECGPKRPGTYRIVMTGSSVALGEGVQREQSFAALLPVELSAQTGRKIELYNESMGWGFSHSVSLRFNEVIAARPDLILWILTPFDIEGASLVVVTTKTEASQQTPLSLPAKAWLRVKAAFASKSIRVATSEIFGRTRTALMLRHFLYQSQSQYMRSYLMAGDEEAGFFRVDPSTEWRKHLAQFDTDAADVEGQARAAGVPFVAVLVPSRAQAAMVSMGEWPAGVDPYKLDDEVRAIITSYGGTYIDILPHFRDIPNPERYYFPVDGHPTAVGHRIISELLARELTSGAVPALRVAAQPASRFGPTLSHP